MTWYKKYVKINLPVMVSISVQNSLMEKISNIKGNNVLLLIDDNYLSRKGGKSMLKQYENEYTFLARCLEQNVCYSVKEAYELGMRPYSEWTKDLIIEDLKHFQNLGLVSPSIKIEELKRIPEDALKKGILTSYARISKENSDDVVVFFDINYRKLAMAE